jgi:hypothetical protein
MSTGSWLNYDGLYLQYGTTKAVPELGGDYVMFGPWRQLEVMVSLGAGSFSNPILANNTLALPQSFQGTVASQTASANTGIISYTTFFPLQPTAPVTAATSVNSIGVLEITNPQIAIGQIDFECLVTASGSSATGINGIGLVVTSPSATTVPAWASVTPITNAGRHLLGAVTNAKMTVGQHYTYYADGTAFGTASAPTAGDWMGTVTTGYQVPKVTNSIAYFPGSLPNNAYLNCFTTGSAQYTASTDVGLFLFSVKYRQMFTVNDANQI